MVKKKEIKKRNRTKNLKIPPNLHPKKKKKKII